MPSKRARKIPEKIQVSQEDLAVLKNTSEPQSSEDLSKISTDESEEEDLSIDDLKEVEA